MISAKLLRSLAPMRSAPGIRRRRRYAKDGTPRCLLGGGVSKLAFVHATPESSEMWTVRYRVDGYSFRLGLKNRVLAGYVARLIHAAADPEGFKKSDGLGVNYYAEYPAPETLYKAHDASVFRLRVPDGQEHEGDIAHIIIVDSWVAEKIRGYSWFECNQKGMPDSWAVRPVVRVDRKRRSIAVSWMTIESVIYPLRVRPLKKRVTPREIGFEKTGGMYVDLRTGTQVKAWTRGEFFEIPGLIRKKTGKSDGVFTPEDGAYLLPRVGKSIVQKTMNECNIAVVEEEVKPYFPIRSRTVNYKENKRFGG